MEKTYKGPFQVQLVKKHEQPMGGKFVQTKSFVCIAFSQKQAQQIADQIEGDAVVSKYKFTASDLVEAFRDVTEVTDEEAFGEMAAYMHAKEFGEVSDELGIRVEESLTAKDLERLTDYEYEMGF